MLEQEILEKEAAKRREEREAKRKAEREREEQRIKEREERRGQHCASANSSQV